MAFLNYDDCVNRYDPHCYSSVLFYSSFLFLFASIVSYTFQDVLSSLVFLALFITSINHWRYPCYGISRTIDMACCVMIAVYSYLVFLFNYSPFYLIFFEFVFINVVLLLFLEWFLYLEQNPFWVIVHLIVHIYTSYFLIVALYLL
jgi:hypothetical protein